MFGLRRTLLCTIAIAAGCNTQRPAPLPPDTAEPFFAAGLIPTAGDPYNHTSTVVVLPTGEVLVAWGSGADELAADTRIVLARRAADGSPWTDPIVVADKPGLPDANCVLFLDDRGRLHLYHSEMFFDQFCTSFVIERTSDDGGATWTQPRGALPAVCVLLRNKPVILRDGRWLLPAYVEATYQSQFFISIDRGATWGPLTPPLLTLPFGNLQPAVVQRSDGTLFALMRSAAGAGYSWEGVSAGGLWWRLSPQPELPNPGSGLDMIRLSTGHLVVAYNDSPTERTPLVAAISADEGRSWSPPRVIEAGPGQLSYPSLAEGPDELIHCTYSFRLSAIKHATFNRAWIEAGAE